MISIFHIVLTMSVQASQQSCLILIGQLLFEYQSHGAAPVMKVASPYLSMFGLGLNKWGDYDSCHRNSQLYSSVQLRLGPLGYNFLGVCHSQQCTTNDLNNQFVKKVILHQIDESGVLDEFGIPIEQIDYKFLQPFNQKMTFMIGFTIFIIVFLIFLSFALSFMQLTTNFKTRKQRYQIMYRQGINKSTVNETDNDDKIISSKTQNPIIEKDNLWIKILKDFSIEENWNQLFKLNTPDPNLQMFTGIRALAFMMVVYGHQYFILADLTFKMELLLTSKKFIYVWLLDMLYSVDIFFWIGGFFVGFVLFESKKLSQVRRSPLALLMVLVHRLLRLWPCYIIWMMINCNIMPFISTGPRAFEAQWTFYGGTWWRNLLFIDNYLFHFKRVMVWSWYLSNDIQMFISSLALLIIYAYKPKIGKIAIIVMLVATQVAGTIITFQYNILLPGFSVNDQSAYSNYYIKPWARGPPYYLGLIYGVLYREFKSTQDYSLIRKYKEWMNMNNSRKLITQAIFYSSGFAIIGFLSFGYHNAQMNGPTYWSDRLQNFWSAFCRIFYVFGLSLLVFPGMVGVRDMFNSFMNNIIFKFLAKLSFTGYLCHYSIITITGTMFYEAPDISTSSVMQFFFGNLFLTIICATLLTLMVEMPFGKLEQRMMTSLAGSKQRAKSLEGPDISDRLLKK